MMKRTDLFLNLETLKIKADKYALINENSLYEHAQKHVTGDIITYLNGRR